MAEGRSNPILKDRCVDVDFGQRKVVLLTLYENIFISRFGERNIWNVSSALAGFAELLLVSSYALCSMGLARHFAVAENGRRSGQAACSQLWEVDHGQVVRRCGPRQAVRFESTRAVRRQSTEGIYSWGSSRCD